MRPEELESINSELFNALDLDEEQYIIGQATKTVCGQVTFNPQGQDYVADVSYDWS